MKKIKVAIEQSVIIPDEYTDEQINNLLKSKCPNKNFIWCYDNENLFNKKEKDKLK